MGQVTLSFHPYNHLQNTRSGHNVTCNVHNSSLKPHAFPMVIKRKQFHTDSSFSQIPKFKCYCSQNQKISFHFVGACIGLVVSQSTAFSTSSLNLSSPPSTFVIGYLPLTQNLVLLIIHLLVHLPKQKLYSLQIYRAQTILENILCTDVT